MRKLLTWFGTLCGAAMLTAADPLADGWQQPPTQARVRAYWWWLNGNVTKAAITRDLEEMKAKGFGGALICDAGGAEQDGNDRVKHGPTFFTPEWRELYRHTLREADRLGLEMSLNIQSGWNLGGPMVSADDAAKKLVWSETLASGPGRFTGKLPAPKSRDNYYRDTQVLAYRLRAPAAASPGFLGFTASSAQTQNPIANLGDGKAETFWVSDSREAGQGPTKAKPAWVQLAFASPITANRLVLTPRPTYGPRECELQVAVSETEFLTIKAFAAAENRETAVDFPATTGKVFRVMIYGAFDPRFPEQPRNVQIAELKLAGPGGAWPSPSSARPALKNWQQKAGHQALSFSAPDTRPLFEELPETPGEEDVRASEVVILTGKLQPDGGLDWVVPEGQWQVLRFGCTIGDHSHVSTCSEGWSGYALDVLDAGAFQRYWNAVVEPLLADAGPLAGKTLKYLHTDSWEVEPLNWTPNLLAEFRRRRGYDPLPYLPTLAGRIVDSRQVSNRFLNDFRRTIGDLAIDCHYRPFRDGAHRHGMLIHPESGGPHAVPIDAQRCLGQDDMPMSEFWAWSWKHRVGDANRFFVKQPASAAHTYGHRFVAAEGFTTIGPHWQETLWDNLKPSFDQAICEGLNLLVWHAFVCSPAEEGLPGIQYFAGTHLNPNVTWWRRSEGFFSYLNRCQWMMQQGLFVADAAYYYGSHVPNFAQLRRTDPARLGAGYDYDVITAEALLERLSVQDGRLVLPDGMSYRVLVLPDRSSIDLPVLRKLRQLVHAGATIIGPAPATAESLQGYPVCDTEVGQLAAELWGANHDKPPIRKVGAGRVVTVQTARTILEMDGVAPDFSVAGGDELTSLQYLHRRAGTADIYFVANRSNRAERVTCQFRAPGKAPELWNPVTGERRFAAAYAEAAGLVKVPLDFPPYGSWLVVFREPAAAHPATAPGNRAAETELALLAGAWTVRFDPAWGGPEQATFEQLTSWPERPEPGIRYYSGAATYEKSFDLPAGAAGKHLWLDLGRVRELAQVTLNGKNLGIVWAPPFRVDLTGAVQPTGNRLVIEVLNFWPNRIIGDAGLPPEKRLTRTNVRKLTAATPLMESGLLGPVKLVEAESR